MRYFGYFLERKRTVCVWGLLLASYSLGYLSCCGMNFHPHSFIANLSDQYEYGFLAVEVALVLGFFFLKADLGANFDTEWLRFKKGDLWSSVKLFLKVYAFGILASLLFRFLSRFVPFQGGLSTPTSSLDHLYNLLLDAPLPLLLAWLLLNAWIEECLNRAVLMNELNRMTKKSWVVVVLSALFQAGYHLYQGWARSLFYFFLFLFFADYYQRNKRIAPVFLAHVYIDGFGTVFLRLYYLLGHKLPG